MSKLAILLGLVTVAVAASGAVLTRTYTQTSQGSKGTYNQGSGGSSYSKPVSGNNGGQSYGGAGQPQGQGSQGTYAPSKGQGSQGSYGQGQGQGSQGSYGQGQGQGS
ncbi:unnamed protein product, partial [Allacma fusca]